MFASGMLKALNSVDGICDAMVLGIVLSWNMTLTSRDEPAATYHLYAYQEGSEPPSPTLWKRVSCWIMATYFYALFDVSYEEERAYQKS